jgi:hypothetical protein
MILPAVHVAEAAGGCTHTLAKISLKDAQPALLMCLLANGCVRRHASSGEPNRSSLLVQGLCQQQNCWLLVTVIKKLTAPYIRDGLIGLIPTILLSSHWRKSLRPGIHTSLTYLRICAGDFTYYYATLFQLRRPQVRGIP